MVFSQRNWQTGLSESLPDCDVWNTINLSNFVGGKLCHIFLFILFILSYKDNKNQPTYQIFVIFLRRTQVGKLNTENKNIII
jgi:hypothetical protein